MNLKEVFKDSFLSGLVLLTPLIATFLIVSLVLGWTSGITGFFIDTFDLSSLTFRTHIAAQILVLAGLTAMVTVIGRFSRSRAGKRALGSMGKIVNLVPVYRSLYHSIKNIAGSFAEGQSSYRTAVLAEHPSDGIYRIGFITSESSDEIEEAAGEELVNVYLPNSPTPTAGITAMMPREKLHELDMSVKKAFKLLVTTGVSNEKIDEIIDGAQVS
jgi:uncharacterized membrane protein